MAKNLSDTARKNKSIYNVQYNADKTTRLPINLNTTSDADILQFLNTVPNKQGLVKELLRRHMNETGFVYEPAEDNT